MPIISVAQTELPRDRWDRPLIQPPDGSEPVAYTRTTTLAGAIDDTYNLSKWQQRMVALGMARRPDLVLGAAAISDPDDRSQKKTLDRLASDALDAAHGKAKATTGTAIHSFTETIDQGKAPEHVPPAYIPDLAAFWNVTRGNGLVARDIEGFCVLDEHRVGGTYDRLYTVQNDSLMTPSGQHASQFAFIGDVKTGNVDFGMGKIAIQLGIYSRSVKYDHRDGSRTPLDEVADAYVNQDWGIVIHLPAGTGTARLLWVDLNAGFEAMNLAVAVREYRKRKDLSIPFAQASALGDQVVEASAPPKADPIKIAIAAAETEEALATVYTENAALWKPEHTEAVRRRLLDINLG